jgi:hypothetical protein
VPLLGGEQGRVFSQGTVPETPVRPVGVVLVSPLLDAVPGFGQGGEVVLAQALVPQLPLKLSMKQFSTGWPRADEVEGDAVMAGPLVECLTHELRPVIAHDRLRTAARQQQGVERLHHRRRELVEKKGPATEAGLLHFTTQVRCDLPACSGNTHRPR